MCSRDRTEPSWRMDKQEQVRIQERSQVAAGMIEGKQWRATLCAHVLCSALALFCCVQGKTHSICGTDLSSFENRGIIPRAVGHIFRAIQSRPDMSFTLSLSYVEVYNEHVFDLLAVRPPAHVRNPSVAHHIDLPIQEDLMGGTGISIKGLVKRMVSSEQECLDALFQGDAERTIGAHSLNEHSTRSHCIYTLYLSMRSRVESSEKVIHSKLNLVDLVRRTTNIRARERLCVTSRCARSHLLLFSLLTLPCAGRLRAHQPHRFHRRAFA